MAISPSLSIVSALKYSAQFNFPLTSREIWYWQPFTSFSQSAINLHLKQLTKSHKVHLSHRLFSLSSASQLQSLRHGRRSISAAKIKLAYNRLHFLRYIPTIQAVYLTGSVAAHNASEDDDIDVFIVTLPSTLWFTRFLVVSLLKLFNLRKTPGLSPDLSPNQICDNLWLDMHHLSVPTSSSRHHNLYLAHEILQAIPLFSSPFIVQKFLLSNSWAASYLPVAYKSQSSNLSVLFTSRPIALRFIHCSLSFLLFLPNLFLFFLQYLYMLPRKTCEQVGLGYAYFHPNPTPYSRITPKHTLDKKTNLFLE